MPTDRPRPIAIRAQRLESRSTGVVLDRLRLVRIHERHHTRNSTFRPRYRTHSLSGRSLSPGRCPQPVIRPLAQAATDSSRRRHEQKGGGRTITRLVLGTLARTPGPSVGTASDFKCSSRHDRKIGNAVAGRGGPNRPRGKGLIHRDGPATATTTTAPRAHLFRRIRDVVRQHLDVGDPVAVRCFADQ